MSESSMKPTIIFPDGVTRTTPLGVGMATLMREPSAAMQQRLLHAAHEAGFRHFDVAPSYGLGAAEAVLGRFLRTRPEGVTVGTKVGISVRGSAGLMRLVQRPARAVLRRFPGLRGRATRTVGGVVHVATDFSIASCQRTLEASLRALGVDVIDLYLLHEAQPADTRNGALAEWLGSLKERGLIRHAGVASSASAAAAIVGDARGAFDAVQVPSHVLAPALETIPRGLAPLRVTHGVLAAPLAQVASRLRADPEWGRALSDRLGADANAPGVAPRMLLAWGGMENRNGVVLLGTSTETHLRSAPEALGAFAPERLAEAADFLRATLLPG